MSKEPNRNVYVGHRYVPLILEEWDKKYDYEGLSVVTYKGASYTSKKRVPVGIDILNKEFWSLTGNYNAQVEYYREETERVSEKLDSKSDVTYVDTELDKKSDQTYVDTELGKKANKTYVDTELGKKADKSYTDTELGKKADKTYVDTELDKKSDKTYVDTELGKKTDLTLLDDTVKDIEKNINIVNSKVYHLENFGGKGDGVTNSFPAFMEALEEIKKDGGSGVIHLLNGTYLMQPTTSTLTNNKPIDISEIDNLVLTSNDNNAVFKLGAGLKHSDFIYSMNPEQSLTVRNIIFDANAINNPMATGTDPNPRTQAQRMFGIYAKNMIFENNTFRDFYGVNIVIANRNNEVSGESITRFDGNRVTNFGRDYSGAVHDTSAFYTHANTPLEDKHIAICTNNTFVGNDNVTLTNSFSAVELGAKNIIATNNVIHGFHCGIITAHQYVTENMVISDNVITRCGRGVYLWAYYVTQSTEAIRNAIVKDNSIFIDTAYWGTRGVYTAYEPNSTGHYEHNYTGIGFHPGIARDINNLSIEDNQISYSLSSSPVNENYSAIMIEQLAIPNEKPDLTYSNFSIKNNRILNAPGKAISIIGKMLERFVIEGNEIINPLIKKTTSKNIIFIRGRETYSEINDLYIKGNIIDLTHADVGITIQTEGKLDNFTFERNNWENEHDDLIQQIDFMVTNKVTNLFIDEIFKRRCDPLFIDLKENSVMIYCNVITPEGVLDTNGKITYYVNELTDLKSRLYHINDEVILNNPEPEQYKGYICFVGGIKGGWYGYGKVDPERIDL